MQFKGFTLDKFQEEAIKSIDKDHSIMVSAPTGSGKTLIADYIIDKELKGEKKIIYTAPLKALSNQKFKDFKEDYGEDKIGLITGDVVINPQAQILIMTTEVYRNMTITNDESLKDVSYCVMDEIHFMGDAERGHVWEEAIIFSPENIRFIFLSATIPNAKEMASWVKKVKNHEVNIITHNIRSVPLEIKFYDAELGITTLDKIKKQKELDKIPSYRDAHHKKRFFRQRRIPAPRYDYVIKDLKNQGLFPCIYFVFSRAKTQDYSSKLAAKNNYLTLEEFKKLTHIVTEEFSNLNKEIKSLKTAITLRECLSKGIGFHHAGLLPDLKTIVEKLFGLGLIKVLFATETFAVGINMPAKSVCFDGLRKYTDTGFRYLNSKEFFQISGRAGRRGIDKKGVSISLIKRFADEIGKIRSFTRKDDLPINSQFKLSPNTVINMIKRHTKKEIDKILQMNFYTFQRLKGNVGSGKVLGNIKARYDVLYKRLKKLEYVDEKGLTPLGEFMSYIFSNEFEISQIFSDEKDFDLDEYEILLVLGAMDYEGRKDTQFFKKFNSKKVKKLEDKLRAHPVLKRFKWHKHLEDLTAIIQPVFYQKGFLEVMKNTTLLEGDIVRFLLRIMDKLEQIGKATQQEKTRAMTHNCKDLIRECLEGMQVF